MSSLHSISRRYCKPGASCAYRLDVVARSICSSSALLDEVPNHPAMTDVGGCLGQSRGAVDDVWAGREGVQLRLGSKRTAGARRREARRAAWWCGRRRHGL